MRTSSGEPESISGNVSAGKIKRYLQILGIASVVAVMAAASGTLSDFLARSVTFEKKVARVAPGRDAGNATMIYVLGGNQASLIQRFKEASILYHRGVAGKIHILSRPGITEFSPDLRRNLTNDEWSARELEMLEVKKGDVVPVAVEPSYFGTLSEARRISEMVRKEGYGRLVLVSSFSHTRRARDSFHRFLGGTPVDIYIHGTGSPTGFKELVFEYIKLILYDSVVLPVSAGST